MNLAPPRIRVIAASVAFWAWCALLSFPLIGDSTATYAICQIVGLALFLAAMSLAYLARFSSTVASMNLAQIAIFLIVYLSLMLQLHDDELGILNGIFYTGLLAAMAAALSVLWTLDPADFERCMMVTSVILCLFGISAIAIHGWPEGRNIGGLLHPNTFGGCMLAGFLFSQFRPGLIGIGVRVLCLGMVGLVSSRYALIGCMITLLLHEMTFNPLSPWKVAALIIAVVAGIVLWPEIASIMALNDMQRGFSSGFTGRDEYWWVALDAIANNPLGIGFKRGILDEATSNAGHNGYLKLILEFGIPGGGLLIFLIACIFVIATIDAFSPASKSRQQHRFECARFGGLGAVLFGAFFQPQVFNLGDTFAVALVLLLFKPRTRSIPARRPIANTA